MRNNIIIIMLMILVGVGGYFFYLKRDGRQMSDVVAEDVTPTKQVFDDVYQSVKDGWNRMLDLVVPSDNAASN